MLIPFTRRMFLFIGGLILFITCQSGYALKFDILTPYQDKPDRKILLIRDCVDSKTIRCKDDEKGFYPGDSKKLRGYLNSNRFAEIWLNSNGGNLHEGVEIGRILRERRQFVRIPDGMRCVSACTVAFLGGFLRTIEPGASYEVHAYSRVYETISEQVLHSMKIDPEFTLANQAHQNFETGRMWAEILMTYFQEMLNGKPNKTAIRAATIGKNNNKIPYLSDGSLQRDLSRFKKEGIVALQDIIMRMERDSMELAINDLKAVQNTLGRRADAAIKILEIMFTSRITGTAVLNQSTLREMGFINVRE